MTIQSAKYKLRIVITPSGPSPGGIALPPQDGGTLIYQWRFSDQQPVDQLWKSAGGTPSPKIHYEANVGPFLRWFIRDTEPFGRLQPPAFMRAESGVWDADILMRIPQSWFDLGKLPTSDPGNGGYWIDFGAMKVGLRYWPLGGSGHNATLFGSFREGTVKVRDFGSHVVQPETKAKPDVWVTYRIRYDYPNKTVGFWEYVNGAWTEIGTVNGGYDSRDIDRSEAVGILMHSTTRKIGPPDGGHYPPAWVDYHSYRVIQR